MAETENRASLEHELEGYKARAAHPNIDEETAAMLAGRISQVEELLGIKASRSSSSSKASRSSTKASTRASS